LIRNGSLFIEKKAIAHREICSFAPKIMQTRKLLDRIYYFLSLRPVYHGLFWLVLFSVMIGAGYNQDTDFSLALTLDLIGLFFYAILVYFNLYYLIPNYLAKRAFLYFALVIVSAALITPIEVFVLYVWFSKLPVFRNILVNSQMDFFFGNVLVTMLSTTCRVIMDWWRYQTEKQVLLTQTMQSELRFLKSQINPHFLFNTLNNLYALTLKKSDQAPEIVLKLSEIMRYMLYECNERRVLLSKEIQYIHNYLDLERLRQPKEADISFVTEGHISEQMVAPLLFVPFLENSFKHGLNHQLQGGGFVRLHLRVSGDNLEFFIENSKAAENLPRLNHPRSGGIGLVNVRQRLQMLYPEQHELQFQDEPHRFAVTLHLEMT
jgi:two-component system, LytTR family, sensor kinase